MCKNQIILDSETFVEIGKSRRRGRDCVGVGWGESETSQY